MPSYTYVVVLELILLLYSGRRYFFFFLMKDELRFISVTDQNDAHVDNLCSWLHRI